MKIALVHAHAWPEVRRGGERYVHDLTWYLGSRGHDVEVITGTSGPGSLDRSLTVTHRRVHNPRGRWAIRYDADAPETIGFRALRPLLRRFDVVHAFTESAAVAAKLTGHRTVYTNLGLADRMWLQERPRAWRWFRAATRAADVTTAVSATAAARAADVSGRAVVPLFAGIRTEAFAPDLGVRTGPPRILYASALDEWSKGLHVLLAAMPIVLHRHPDARLQLAGPGEPARAFGTLDAATARVLDAVDRIDPDTSLPTLYRAATATALPSSHEALGLVLLESLACGTPVVACAAGGPTEIVTDERIGRLAPLDDPAALAASLCEVIDLARSAGTAERCAAHARRWDWATSVGPDHEVLYRRIIGETIEPA